MRNLALKEAFNKTEAGRSLAHVARSTVVGDRIRALKGAAHNVFVEQFHRWDIFQASREVVRSLGVRGGPAYDKALELVSYALIDKNAYKEAIQLLAPAIAARHEEVAGRIRTLKQLVYDTYVGNVPAGQRKRHDVYYDSKEFVRKLGLNGGKEYEHVLTAVKFASNDQKSWNEGIEALLPSPTGADENLDALHEMAEVAAEVQATEEIAKDCESSDGMVRHQ